MAVGDADNCESTVVRVNDTDTFAAAPSGASLNDRLSTSIARAAASMSDRRSQKCAAVCFVVACVGAIMTISSTLGDKVTEAREFDVVEQPRDANAEEEYNFQRSATIFRMLHAGDAAPDAPAKAIAPATERVVAPETLKTVKASALEILNEMRLTAQSDAAHDNAHRAVVGMIFNSVENRLKADKSASLSEALNSADARLRATKTLRSMLPAAKQALMSST